MTILDWPTLWLNLTRLAIILFTGLIAWMTYRSYVLIKEVQLDFNILLSPLEVIARIILVSFCLLLAWSSGLSPAQLGFTIENPWWSIGLGFSLGVVTQLAVNVVTKQIIKRVGREVYSPWLIRNILPRQRYEWVLLALAFLPPIAMEELLFRTLWLGGFRDILPLPLLIGGTSILFGLMHQPQGRLGVVLTGAINILFCVLFIWTGELLVTLVAHYTINLLQVIAANYQREWLETY